MKNSKIVLGGTAFLLTVAGVVATKASKNNHHFNGFTKSSGPCRQLTAQVTATKVAGSAILRTASLTQTVFTSQSCSTPFYTRDDRN